jgi:hypothetical protein
VRSVVWTLGNRGSKYWQEKVERIEDASPRFTVTLTPVQQPCDALPMQPMFKTRERRDTNKGWWLRGRLFYHQNKLPHWSGRSDCKKSRPQMRADARG